jgi:hypothetical protein
VLSHYGFNMNFINNDEHFFIYLLVIFMSFKKCLFRSLTHFNRVFSLYSVTEFLYILYSLPDVWLVYVFLVCVHNPVTCFICCSDIFLF